VLASKVSGRPIDLTGWGPTGAVLSLDLGGYFMQVRHWGAFSNTKGTTHHATRNATDVSFDAFRVGRLTTTHPLAVAMSELGAHREVLQLVNLAIRADANRRTPLLAPESLFAPEHTRVGRQPRKVDEERLKTAEHYRGLLEESHTLNELYEILVPSLMNYRDFQTVFGRPGRRDTYRYTQRAQARFQEYLDNLSAGA